MATEGLKIVIGADIGSAIAGISKLTDAMQGISGAAEDAAGSLGKIPAALRPIDPAKMKGMQDAVQKLKQDIAGLPKNPIPDPFKNIPKGANQAANAITNLGRVAQDLPFGFVGIQNNLNPLLESFQRLRAETGSGKAALAALGQSLIGPAGIGIALSVVSAAILIFQNGIAGFNSKTKEAKEKADEFAKSIRSIGLVQQEATAGVEGQISTVNALAAAVSNSNLPYAQRKRALEELKDINKAYFGDLKLEDAATGALTKTVDEYTKALVNNAIQKGFADEIAEVAKAVAKQDDVIAKSRLKLAQAQKAVTEVENFLPSGTRDIETARAQKRQAAIQKEKDALEDLQQENEKVTTLLTQEAVLRDQLNRAILEGTKFKKLDTDHGKKDSDGLNKQLDLLEKIRDAAKDFQGLQFDLKDIDAATDKLANLEQQVGDLKLKIALRDAKKAGLPAEEIEKLKDAIKEDTQKRLNEAFEKEALLLEFSSKLKFSLVNRAEIPQNIDSLVAKATGFDKKIPVITIQEARIKLLGFKLGNFINQVEKLNEQLKEQIKGIFEGGLSDVFSSLGEGFGEALASSDFGGSLKKAAQNILGIVGGVMQQLGKALITAAIKIKLLKETFEKWAIANPALAIIAGIGLVAAGAALKNIKFDGPKFAEGGIVTGPVIGQIGEMHRPEVVMPLDRLKVLIGSGIANGGNNGTQIIPFINNEGLYLAVKRGERTAGRNF